VYKCLAIRRAPQQGEGGRKREGKLELNVANGNAVEAGVGVGFEVKTRMVGDLGVAISQR